MAQDGTMTFVKSVSRIGAIERIPHRSHGRNAIND